MKTAKAVQMVLAIAMTSGALASAQTARTLTLSSGLSMQAGVAMNVAQVKDNLFAGAEKFAQGASEVTEINLDPSTMGMLGHRYGPDSGLAGKMNFMVIHSYKYDKPGMYSMDDFEAYAKKLTDGSWNCYIHVRNEKNGSTDICSRTAADHETNEMVILTAEPREITFIHMSGKMSLGDLSRMSDSSRSIKLKEPFKDTPAAPAPSVRVPVVPVTPAVPAAPTR